VPVPIRVGAPSDAFPWAWSVVPWFDGLPASTLQPAGRRAWARALADFIADLHLPAPEDAPANPYRGVPLAARDAVVRPRLTSFEASGRLLAVWESALRAPPWDGPPVWLHGDLHPANLIVRDRRLAAVIDFIDLTSGDPATDLATAWLTFDAAGRADFRAALDARCGHRAETWARARGWALALASAIADDTNRAMAALAAHTLRHVLLD
jgi:aminoglycoside phosphotransferase (APT) family kinase protein